MATKNNTTVNFVKYGRWLLPRSDEDMTILSKFNLTLTKWDADYISTLKLILSKKKYSVEVSQFSTTVLNPTLEKLEKFWCRGKNKILFSKNQIKLTGSNDSHNVQKLRTIEQKLRVFFDRWGFTVDVVSNETKTRCGLTIDYTFSNERNPLITKDDASHEVDFDPAILEMDNYRLVLNRHGEYFGFSFEEKEQGDWVCIKKHTHLKYDKLKSSKMISTLFEMFNMS